MNTLLFEHISKKETETLKQSSDIIFMFVLCINITKHEFKPQVLTLHLALCKHSICKDKLATRIKLRTRNNLPIVNA